MVESVVSCRGPVLPDRVYRASHGGGGWVSTLILVFLLAFLFSASPSLAGASEVAAPAGDQAQAVAHTDPIAPVLLGILIILLAARVGGHLLESVGQPAVLGELLVGVLLGNLALLGYGGLDFLKVNYDSPTPVSLHDSLAFAGVTIDHLARIGVILLLFQVGLETSMAAFRKVGLSAFLVATIGVVCPMVLGWASGYALLPHEPWAIHMFLGATLAATSVGITARVLRDLGKATTHEAQIILGAAVIDDVLGLVVLAVVQGIILSMGMTAGGSGFGVSELGMIFLKALGFLVGSLILGQYVSRSLFKGASLLRGHGMLLLTSLVFCFGLAWLANLVGLAPIVGAFAAGLILEKVQYQSLTHEGEKEQELEELVRPLGDVLVPIFFVMMGIQVDLRSFMDPTVLGLAAVLIIAAIAGKQACALGAIERGLDRRSIGIGMIPRGEVGLIFAAIGRQLRVDGEQVVSQGIYSALVLMVIVTTLVTPPLLKWSLTAWARTHDTGSSNSAGLPPAASL